MNHLKRPRTCNGCRALNEGQGISGHCELGYNNVGPLVRIVLGANSTTMRKLIPQEPCPKPLTLSALMNAPKQWEGTK